MRTQPMLATAPAATGPATTPSNPAQGTAVPTSARPPLDSAALLGGRSAVDIVHNGAVYRLQATRLGKLILTK